MGLVACRREHDDLYLPAKNYLDELEEVGRMFAIPAVEHVLGAIERYHGTTAGDVLKFMHDQDVRFGVAQTDVERDLYRKLYAALLQQSLDAADPGGDRRRRAGVVPAHRIPSGAAGRR